MELIWKEEYSVGIKRIDQQHEEIFKLLLAVENSVEKKDGWNIQRFFWRIAAVAPYEYVS